MGRRHRLVAHYVPQVHRTRAQAPARWPSCARTSPPPTWPWPRACSPASSFPIVCVPTDYETEGLWPHLSHRPVLRGNRKHGRNAAPAQGARRAHPHHGHPHARRFPPHLRPRGNTASAWTCRRTSASCWRWPVRTFPRPYVHFRDALGQSAAVSAHARTFAALRVRCRKRRVNTPRHLRTSMRRAGHFRQRHRARIRGGHGSAHGRIRSGHLQVGRAHRHGMLVRAGAHDLAGPAPTGRKKRTCACSPSLGAAMHVTTWRELLGRAAARRRTTPTSARAMLVNGSFLRRPNAARDIAARHALR